MLIAVLYMLNVIYTFFYLILFDGVIGCNWRLHYNLRLNQGKRRFIPSLVGNTLTETTWQKKIVIINFSSISLIEVRGKYNEAKFELHLNAQVTIYNTTFKKG